jgi:hypothetical protein
MIRLIHVFFEYFHANLMKDHRQAMCHQRFTFASRNQAKRGKNGCAFFTLAATIAVGGCAGFAMDPR